MARNDREDTAPANIAIRRGTTAIRGTSNTCAPSSLAKRLTRQLSGIMAHLETNPNDNLSRERVSRINELLKGHN